MEFALLTNNQWNDVKEIYMEAFPKKERKPFRSLKKSVKKNKAVIWTAMEKESLLGFVVVIPYKNMVMVDYLAVSSKIRSKGTGSYLMKRVCETYAKKKVVLLIECLDDLAKNKEQRIARRRFYVKNGFTSSNLFITGVSGEMEVLNYGECVTAEEYLDLQQYALGKLFFTLSKIRLLPASFRLAQDIGYDMGDYSFTGSCSWVICSSRLEDVWISIQSSSRKSPVTVR